MPSNKSINLINELNNELYAARQLYMHKRPLSLAANKAAESYMPGGNTRTALYNTPFPIRVSSYKEGFTIDVDGRYYKDFLGGYGAGIFGPKNPTINTSIIEAMDKGVHTSLSNIYELHLARVICKRFQSIELVRFTSSGSEASLMAIAAAKSITGRSKIMAFHGGYHASTLSFGSIKTGELNAPHLTLMSRYNDTQEASNIIQKFGAEIACVIVEPMLGASGCIPAESEFLTVLRRETEKAGCLLIFDEVLTSRLAYGGAQMLYGIAPDFTILGKYIGGGLPLGAFGGKRSLMMSFDPTQPNSLNHGGTHNNNPLAMAAGIAGLQKILTLEKTNELNSRGDVLRHGLNQIFHSNSINMQASGMGSLMKIHTTKAPIKSPLDIYHRNNSEIIELIFLDLIEQGILIAKNGFIALDISILEGDVIYFITCMTEIIDRRKKYLRILET